MVKLISEVIAKKQQILIVVQKNTHLYSLLKKKLESYDIDVFRSPDFPLYTSRFDHIFFISGNIIRSMRKRGEIHEKIITLTGGDPDEDELDKILWFSFSKNKERHLEIKLKRKRRIKPVVFGSPFKSSLKNDVLKIGLLLFLIACFIFIPFLIIASLLNYNAFMTLQQDEITTTQPLVKTSRLFTNTAATLYNPVRPVYSFFSLTLVPDTAIQINRNTQEYLLAHESAVTDLRLLLLLIADKNKTVEKKTLLILQLSDLQKSLQRMQKETAVLDQTIPRWTNSLKDAKRSLSETIQKVTKLRSVLPVLKALAEKEGFQKYLILIVNDSDLRPGGGTIESLGEITTQGLNMQKMNFFSAGDIDSSLSAHIDPPKSLKTFAGQDTLFLRDTAISPDFFDVAGQVQIFLERERGFTNYSGTILITTSGLEYLLSAYPTHRSSQIIERASDPQFISGIFTTVLDTLSTVPFGKLGPSILKAFDEKQLVILLNDNQLQPVFDQLYWSGKTISSRCIVSDVLCVNDYIFPYDQNVGKNNINTNIQKRYQQRVRIAQDGSIHNNLVVTLENTSPLDDANGGIYKNYLQILLPKNVHVEQITKNNVLIEDYDEITSQYKGVGFYLEVSSRKKVEINVAYSLEQTMPQGGVYQLTMQKQIGAPNADMTLEIMLPNHLKIQNKNFTAVVKDGRILYNTNLNADKLFFLELTTQQ